MKRAVRTVVREREEARATGLHALRISKALGEKTREKEGEVARAEGEVERGREEIEAVGRELIKAKAEVGRLGEKLTESEAEMNRLRGVRNSLLDDTPLFTPLLCSHLST